MALPVLAPAVVAMLKRLLVTVGIAIAIKKVADYFGISEEKVREYARAAGLI